LALKSDGVIWAWGGNNNGQLGDNSTTDRLSPVQVSGLTNPLMIVAGGNHSVALAGDGTVWAWGGNMSGELGDGTTTSHHTPNQVPGLTGVVAISAGLEHVVALK
jgi:alpha-tubulin suppressor-like RCC1 family protein